MTGPDISYARFDPPDSGNRKDFWDPYPQYIDPTEVDIAVSDAITAFADQYGLDSKADVTALTAEVVRAEAAETALQDRSNHTGTESADVLTDGTTKKAFLATERTKLSGIATGATANQTDAYLLDRTHHTGSQTSTTISDFTEAVQDAVAALLLQGTNVTLNYDDAANTLSISASGGSSVDLEQVRDAIGVALVGISPIQVTVNDALDTITITTTATVNQTDAYLLDRTHHTGSQLAASISDFAEAAQDAVAAAFVNANGITITYNDSSNSLTLVHDGSEGVNTVAATGANTTLPGPPITVHDLTVDTNCLITLPSGFSSSRVLSILVILRQPSSGGSYFNGVTWSGTIQWFDGGSAPAMATGQGAVTAVTLMSVDGGAHWLGSATVLVSSTVVVTLTDAATVGVDASLGNNFVLTMGGNRTIATPTNAVNGKMIVFWLVQDGTGSRVPTWGSGYRFGTDVGQPILSTGAGKTDYVGFKYNGIADKWDCLAVARGY